MLEKKDLVTGLKMFKIGESQEVDIGDVQFHYGLVNVGIKK